MKNAESKEKESICNRQDSTLSSDENEGPQEQLHK